ncbi:MAG: hypothetical protein BMS9Abin05_2744 [Rhodothermia bacterium]|nr:MAG: hypothetical protein BMS9Abin05_2744 [Rhodothermia bacterium]
MINESIDPEHGRRGAELAKELRGLAFDLDQDRFDLVYTACLHHKLEVTHPDVTIQTCWDSDRLDLGRVNIVVDPRFLSTDVAREMDTIYWADERATIDYEPPIVSAWRKAG